MWYRPPNSSINLFVDFKAVLEKIEALNIESHILGDFKCNTATTSPDGYTLSLLANTSTLVDLFLMNKRSKFNAPGL